MDRVAQAVHEVVRGGVALGDDFVDVPPVDAEDLEGNRVVADEVAHAVLPRGHGGIRVGFVGDGEDDEHPFVPGLDHADQTRPGKVRVRLLGLEDPV